MMQDATEKAVYIIVLNYKNLADTVACLASLRKITYNKYRIVVVDNDSQDGSYESLKAQETDCCVLQSGENRGYAAGNNIGIRYALEQGAEYVCILNNDVETEPDFLTKLVRYMESAPDVGMTGPIHSVLGVKKEISIRRMKDRIPIRFENADGPCKMECAIFDIDESTGLSRGVQRLRIL